MFHKFVETKLYKKPKRLIHLTYTAKYTQGINNHNKKNMPQPISVVREGVQAFGLVVEKAISQKKNT